MSSADPLSMREMEKKLQTASEKRDEFNFTGYVPWGQRTIDSQNWTTPLTTITMSPQDNALYAVLTDKERDKIRQIVAEEVAKVFPIPQVKPEGVLPECPVCHGWELSGHDPLTPLDTQYRRWWCVCPEKVAAWEKKCKEDLDRLMEAIHDPDSEIEAMLVEMSSDEFEGLIEKVRARRASL